MKKIFDNRIFKFGIICIKAFLIIMMVFYVAFVVAQRLSGNQSIMQYRFFTVATGSMKGVYNINDVIAVHDCNSKDLNVGDDIAYIGTRAGLEGKIIVHRIIKVEDASDGGKILTTKGVNSPNSDPSITDDQVLGLVVGKVPVISQINHVVRSQVGFFSLIFFLFILVIVPEILQSITVYQLEKKQIQEVKRSN